MRDYVNSTALQEYTTKLVAKLKTLFPGTPTAAATVADMTDHSKTYVYVGSETGYTAGDWYYWDGSAWTSGGPFQATSIITDTTLAVAGEAADAKATGDAIAAAKTAVLNAMAPAYSTSSTYAVGDYVNYNGSIYRCTTAITTAEAWTEAHWTQVDLADDVADLKNAIKTGLTIPVSWEQGRLSAFTGEKIASNNAIRSKDFIDVTSPSIYIMFSSEALPEGAQELFATVIEYSSKSPATYVKYTSVGRSATNEQRKITFDPSTVAFKVYFNYTTANTYPIAPEKGYLCNIVWGNSPMYQIDVVNNINDRTPLPLIWEQGRLTTGGEEADSDTQCRTKSISIRNNTLLGIVQPPKTGVDVYFYNDNTLVERVPIGTGSTAKIGTRYYEVPDGANNFRLTYAKSSGVTPDIPQNAVFAFVTDSSFSAILHGAENGIHRHAKMRSFGNSILTGTVYPDGNIGHIVSFDNAPYGGVAIGLGIDQRNTEHTLISSTGLLYNAGNGSFLDNIKQTDLSEYDYLLTHLWTADMSNFPVGNVDTSIADDGSIVGGVLAMLSYVRTNNALCNVVLISVPPVSITSAGDGVFDTRYGNGSTIRELDNVMHEMAEKHHFAYIDWQNMYLSYHYQEYTYNSNNVHLADDEPYRIMGEYLSRKINDAYNNNEWKAGINDVKDIIKTGLTIPVSWEQGRLSAFTGEKIASNNAIRSKDFIDVTSPSIYIMFSSEALPEGALSAQATVIEYSSTYPTTVVKYTSIFRSATNEQRKITFDPSTVAFKVYFNYTTANTYPIAPEKGYLCNIAWGGSVLEKIGDESGTYFNEPLLTIIDDDSNEKFYTDLYPVFAANNLPISSAVITGRVGNSSYMTWDQINTCYENGMEMLSHSNRHFLSTDADFETITETEIARDYLKAKNILMVHGIDSQILVFSGSTARYTKFMNTAEQNYKGGFLAGPLKTSGATAEETINHQGSNPYEIQRFRIGNNTDYHYDIDVLKGLIDVVKTTGGWMVWMTHTSGGNSAWSPGTDEGSSAYILGQACEYAVSQGVKVVTAEYGFRKYYPNA